MKTTNLFFIFIFTISFIPLAFAESDFAEYSAFDENGEVIKITDYEGEVLFVNVWATWCLECREEMPYINELHDEFSEKGIRFINISIDANPYDAMEMAERMNMKTELWYDPDDQASRAFKMLGPPVTVLIGADGNQIYKWPGAIMEGTDVETRLADSIGLASEEELAQISTAQQVNLAIAFTAGVLSFLSPCILPLIPSYIAFITGTSLKELSNTGNSGKSKLKIQTTVLTKGSLFILGFSVVFISLGLGVSYLGTVFSEAMLWVERIGGALIIVFGLHLLGVLKINFLNKQKSFNLQNKSTKNFGLLLVGMGFGAGWTPCIGPILASILTLAATSETFLAGGQLLAMYSLGLAIPFLISALAIDQFTRFFQKIRKWIGWIERTSAILLIVIGLILITGSVSMFINFTEELFGF
ncbi:MAG: hypothetical protein EA447_01015 [Nitrosopumilus sp.]|nr:MAG: hypothetical protein EA447_01015 [Nitrosopumilus sp.]